MAGRGPKRPKERVRRFFSVGRIEGDSYLEGPIARCLGRGGKIENRGFFFSAVLSLPIFSRFLN
jgi:hypothetical protein